MIGEFTKMQSNEEQLQAINADAKRLLCLAGAGAGKTATMIARIHRLVSEGADPTSILVLTFTNAAAFEMKDRYHRQFQTNEIPEFRTFHSFCYSILAKDKQILSKLNYNRVPSIATEQQMKELEEKAKKISGADKHLQYNQFNRISLRNKEQQMYYAAYLKVGDKLMRQNNLISFDSLCYDICQLFSLDDPCCKPYKEKYKHIFVDEFQDTDPKQWKFVKSFENSSIFLVGDALQNIYSFRGSTSSIIKALSDDKDWTVVKLHHNYRSTKEICEFANNMSGYASSKYRILLESDREGLPVTTRSDGITNYVEIVDDVHVKQILKTIQSLPGSSAVLARSNKEVKYLRDAFSDAGIEVSTASPYSDLCNVLKSCVDLEYGRQWLASLLNKEHYSKYVWNTILKEEYTFDKFTQEFKKFPEISDMLKLVSSCRKILYGDDLPVNKCKKICKLAEIKEIDFKSSAFTPEDIVASIVKYLTEQRPTSIYIGTIHSSKGLEYDNVFLVGVNGNSFKLQDEDNKNLYYVGITRARNLLYVFRNDK